MRVGYDISVLGLAHSDPLARTGVHRVVRNIAQGLAYSEECAIYFCAPASHRVFYQAERALEADAALRPVPLLAPLRSRAGRWPYTAAARLPGGARAIGRLLDLAGSPLLRQQLEQTDIYHSPFHPLPPRTARARLQRFATVYDLIPELFPHFFEGSSTMHRRLRASLGPEDFVFCISHSTRNDLIEHWGIEPDRVLVHHLAASTEVFYPVEDPERQDAVRRKYGIPNGPYLLGVNTLEPRKNIEQVIRSFTHLVEQERIRDLTLVLVGARGWDRGRIDAAIRRAGAARSRIIRTGFVDDADLAPLYSGALAFVYMPFYEGFGLPPLEAMQCATPVITSDTSSLPEVVGDAGVMIDPMDADALSHAMLRVWGDTGLRRDLADRGRRRAQQFTWERCVRQVLDGYRHALGA